MKFVFENSWIGLLAFLYLSSCQKAIYPEGAESIDTGLPQLHIYIDDYLESLRRFNISKDTYTSGMLDYTTFSSEHGMEFKGKDMEIRGRGNSTWRGVKQPYRLKFTQPISFFNEPPQNLWVILANYADKSLMRNYLAYWLAEQIGCPYPVSYHFVELFAQGQYHGNYLMTDQVEVGPHRVNIQPLQPTDNHESVITGGYLLEIDGRVRNKGKPYFTSTKFDIRVRSPKDISEEQMRYIRNYVIEAERVLYGSNFQDAQHGFRKYFDEASMAKWFIVAELFKNVDAQDFSSIFFFKDRDGKLTMGPIWDFDRTLGNAKYCNECLEPEGWYIMKHHWFNRMYEDPNFQQLVRDEWNQNLALIQQLLPKIDETAQYLDKSQQENYKRWPSFSNPNRTNIKINSYQGHVDYIKDFLTRRIEWMDAQLNN